MANRSKPISHTARGVRAGRTSPSTHALMVLRAQACGLRLKFRRSSNTRRADRMAWEPFLHYHSQPSWQTGKPAAALMVDPLRSVILSPAVIRQRMAAVMSFYTPVIQGLHRGLRWWLPTTGP